MTLENGIQKTAHTNTLDTCGKYGVWFTTVQHDYQKIKLEKCVWYEIIFGRVVLQISHDC